MSLMGIDVGTTGCKAIAFAQTGRVLARAYREYPLLNPAPGRYELDPETVWDAVRDCVRKVNAALDDPVTALAISSQGEAVTPVDKAGAVLANSPVGSDMRGIENANLLRTQLGEEHIYRITGQPVSYNYSLPKIMWWKTQMPDMFERVWKFLCYVEFVSLRLGVEPVIDYSMAARTMALDSQRRGWSAEFLAAAGIAENTMPTLAPSGTVVGRIPENTARELSFASAVEVVVGGHDQPCAALGAGVVESGDILYSIGTTEALLSVANECSPGLWQHHISCYPHVVPEKYVVLAGNYTGGHLLRWYRDRLAFEEKQIAAQSGIDVYDAITQQITDQPSRLWVLPYFAGSGTVEDDPQATGAILGLTFETTRADIVKAIMEGITYEQALTIRILESLGLPIRRVVAVGGGARSQTWLQMKAHILGKAVQTTLVEEASTLGAALLAGWGTGVYASLDDAVEQTVTRQRQFEPDAHLSQQYQEALDIYQTLYAMLKPFYQRTARGARA
ncbi:MAG: hypothetical protein KJ065_16570 [Anaerolineae bacterium]|nr:hypothetical protein [Anaerolineae bacterium]